MSDEPLEPGPLMTQIAVSNGQIEADGQPPTQIVKMEIRTPAGQTVVFLPPEFADDVGTWLKQNAREAASRGIVVVDPAALKIIRENGQMN